MSLILEKSSNHLCQQHQCLYDSANKLASLKTIDHDMISFMNKAQATVKELKMFLELKTLDANDIQRLYDSANKLAPLKMIDHDMISFMNEAQATEKELKMFLEVESLEEIKKKLDEYYMVMILRVVCSNYHHVKDQLLTCNEIPSMDCLITRLLRVSVT